MTKPERQDSNCGAVSWPPVKPSAWPVPRNTLPVRRLRAETQRARGTRNTTAASPVTRADGTASLLLHLSPEEQAGTDSASGKGMCLTPRGAAFRSSSAAGKMCCERGPRRICEAGCFLTSKRKGTGLCILIPEGPTFSASGRQGPGLQHPHGGGHGAVASGEGGRPCAPASGDGAPPASWDLFSLLPRVLGSATISMQQNNALAIEMIFFLFSFFCIYFSLLALYSFQSGRLVSLGEEHNTSEQRAYFKSHLAMEIPHAWELHGVIQVTASNSTPSRQPEKTSFKLGGVEKP